jgi:predicted sulfurtransferase
MNSSAEILSLAAQRATAKSSPYTGELTPREAFEVLQQDPVAVLVDVRSKAELDLLPISNGHFIQAWCQIKSSLHNY